MINVINNQIDRHLGDYYQVRILVIGFTKIKYMPYMRFYLDNIDVLKNDVHLLYWNRDLEEEDVHLLEGVTLHEFKYYQEDEVAKYRKFLSFWKYRNFAINILENNDFDAIVVLHSLPAVLISDKLINKYSGRFILDYRDSTYEFFLPFKQTVARLVKGSYATFVSSDAFRKFLPQSERIKTYSSHNILIDSLSHRDEKILNGIVSDKIRIAFWGFIRHEEINIELINKLAADSRFELHYFGREQQVAIKLKNHVKSHGFTNVFFHGAYQPEDRYIFARSTDIIHNIYADRNTLLAMGNKYYDGAIFRIPQICMYGSFMAEMATRSGIGFACNPFDNDFADRIYQYYKNIQPNVFRENCDRETERAYNEYLTGRAILSKFFDWSV